MYDFNWPGKRCPLCDKPCKNERGVKCHMRHCYYNTVDVDREQNFYRSKPEAAAKTQKLKDAFWVHSLTKEISWCAGTGVHCDRLLLPLMGICCAQGAAGQSGGSRGVVSFRQRRPKRRNTTACPSSREDANTPTLRDTQGAGGLPLPLHRQPDTN